VEEKSMKKRIAILTNIIPPYRLPLFNGIAEKYNLDVLICNEKEKNRKWKINFDNKFNIVKLKGLELNLKNALGDYRFIYLKFSIIFYLLFKRPDYLIIGDASLTSYFAAFLCKLLNIKYIWWNEILPFTPINKGFVEKMRKFAIKNAYHHFVSGSLAKQFIKNYGIPDEKITIIPDAIDNNLYLTYYNKFKNERDNLGKKFNLGKNDFVFLYVGQFIKRKNIFSILNAFKEAKQKDVSLKLILVGGGEEEGKIKDFIKKNKLEFSIIIIDFLDTEELSKIYTISDALILISESEPWGMVVNEAMCFGLPVLASYTVGAAADLIDNKSGIIINDYRNISEITSALLNMKNKKWDKRYIQKKVLSWNNDIAIERVKSVI
jgi:glycosyltransferase involved in cell wall biosynthesis